MAKNRENEVQCSYCGKTGPDVNKAGVYPACNRCERKYG